MAQAGTGHRQRLKERFNARDPQALTEAALLELLLTYAIPQKDVQPLALQLLDRFGSLDAVLSADPATLTSIAGIGDSVVTLLKLSNYLATRPAATTASLSDTQHPEQRWDARALTREAATPVASVPPPSRPR